MIRLKTLYEGQKQTEYELWCDLDGVLCDFEKAWIELTKLSPDQYRKAYGGNAFRKQLDRADEAFWSDMDWQLGGKQLWAVINKYPVKILSAPANSKQSVSGKVKWIERHTDCRDYVFEKSELKQLHATPKGILIDDFDKNVEQWQSRKGIGILHLDINETLKQLASYGIV